MSKFSFKVILVYYLETLQFQDEKGSHFFFPDVFVQCAIPILLGIGCTLLGFTLKSISNLIAGVAIVSALLGAVSVFCFKHACNYMKK